MKVKDFEIIDIFSCLTIKDKNNKELAKIWNDFMRGNEIQNYCQDLTDNRTELEKWNEYKDCEVLKIQNADIDINWENNYVDIIVDL